MTASSTIYREFFGKDRVDEVHWTPGHVSERLPDFHIAKIGPEQANGMWTFATIGAWRATEQDKTSLEFVAVALGEGTAVVWNLALTALLHAGPRENRLGVGHRVPIGERWVEGLSLEVILVSLPSHESVNQGRRQWVHGDVHTQAMEDVRSLFKRSILGSYHHLSIKHLQAYLDEMAFRYNNRENRYLFLDTLLTLVGAGSIPYAELIAG